MDQVHRPNAEAFMKWIVGLLLGFSSTAFAQNFDFKAADIRSVHLHNSTGNVSIAPTLSETAGVSAEPQKWGERCKLGVTLDAGILNINSSDENWILDHECRVNFMISLPPNVDTQIYVGTGDVEVTGMKGRLGLKVGGGTVKINGEFKELQALSWQGPMTINGTAEKMNLKSGQGDVVITYDKAPAKDTLLTVNLGRGNLNVSLPEDTRLYTETITGNGSVRNDFLQERQDHNLKINARASTGDINILKK
jgi:hypothetical protein